MYVGGDVRVEIYDDLWSCLCMSRDRELGALVDMYALVRLVKCKM